MWLLEIDYGVVLPDKMSQYGALDEDDFATSDMEQGYESDIRAAAERPEVGVTVSVNGRPADVAPPGRRFRPGGCEGRDLQPWSAASRMSEAVEKVRVKSLLPACQGPR
jgi:hypothetical protein